MTYVQERRGASPPRLTLAALLDDNLSGAWWPRTGSMAGELAPLMEALRGPLGQVVDVQLNWSPRDGVLDLDALARRGVSSMPGLKSRPQRLMCVTGTTARAKLVVVPSSTTAPLAVLVLRHAAGLPIDSRHHASAVYQAADDIVRAARDQCTAYVNEARG